MRIVSAGDDRHGRNMIIPGMARIGPWGLVQDSKCSIRYRSDGTSLGPLVIVQALHQKHLVQEVADEWP